MQFLASSTEYLSHSGLAVWECIFTWHSRERIFSPGANCPPCSVAQGQQQHKSACLKPPLSLSLSLCLCFSHPSLLSSTLPSLSALIGPAECCGVWVLCEDSCKSRGRPHDLAEHLRVSVANMSVACFVEFLEGTKGPVFALYVLVLKYFFLSSFWDSPNSLTLILEFIIPCLN